MLSLSSGASESGTSGRLSVTLTQHGKRLLASLKRGDEGRQVALIQVGNPEVELVPHARAVVQDSTDVERAVGQARNGQRDPAVEGREHCFALDLSVHLFKSDSELFDLFRSQVRADPTPEATGSNLDWGDQPVAVVEVFGSDMHPAEHSDQDTLVNSSDLYRDGFPVHAAIMPD
jgi:hypothetical protein